MEPFQVLENGSADDFFSPLSIPRFAVRLICEPGTARALGTIGRRAGVTPAPG